MAAKSSIGTDEPAPSRAVIDAVLPNVDNGRFAVKRIVDEPLQVQAHCFADGHDKLRVVLRWHAEEHEQDAREVEMEHRGNDEWFAIFTPPGIGRYRYTVIAWVDHIVSWREDFRRRVEPHDVRVAAQIGADLIAQAARRAKGGDHDTLVTWAALLKQAALRPQAGVESLKQLALDEANAQIVSRYPDRHRAATHALALVVDRERAGFGSWYELFPRSTSGVPGRHGSFKDVEARLPYVREMGFDVLYFPPIHPIGRLYRKGRNNAITNEVDDVGSPWAIGAQEGGHKAILPELGTPSDFQSLVKAANAMGIEIALDIAFQCAPDHPYVKQHPAWFRARPDGSTQYAENPPKKYQDIYPFDFETADWRALWQELKSIFDHWIAQGVRIFRVDNPHTKAFAFWEWAITEIKREHPDVLLLAEAFTRPKVMHRLAKLGFSQSYTYFTWRHTQHELVEYFTELSQGPGSDYFRPNAWPNTPDILNGQLHGADQAMFAVRLVLAATLSANYGIYGPAFELMENQPRSAGSEEYLDSEKYQLRHWNLEQPSLKNLISRVNRIRRENPALQQWKNLRFLRTDNEQLIAYVKRSAPSADAPHGNVVLVVVNLDARRRQSGWIDVDPAVLEPVDLTLPYQMHDLLNGQRFPWQGERGFVILDPVQAPAHVFRVEQH